MSLICLSALGGDRFILGAWYHSLLFLTGPEPNWTTRGRRRKGTTSSQKDLVCLTCAKQAKAISEYRANLFDGAKGLSNTVKKVLNWLVAKRSEFRSNPRLVLNHLNLGLKCHSVAEHD
jgi:hypothetical protein